MAPPALSAVRRSLADVTLDECRDLARAVLGTASAAAARAAIKDAL
jgi:phosphoenolpyruvate-protein kinase (PTS system EI component)